MTSLWDAKRRAVRISGSSSRVRSAGETQCDTLASAATAIGVTANRLPSASAPVTKTEQILCRMLVFRFRSSYHCAALSFANFGIKGTLATL